MLAALSRRNPVVVIVTMRSDFFPRLAEFSPLLALAEGTGSYHLPPPAPVELGQIIRRPAQAAGLRFDAHPETKQGLDEALRDAASADPQVLPLLEFALEELYKRQKARGDGLLRWEDYLAFHGIEGVIAAKADEAVASAGAGTRMDQAVDAVLSALVNFKTDRGETAVPIRRRAAPEEVAPSPEAEKLVSAMLSARLLVSDTDAAGRRTISVAHEALLTRWPRAMAWFETNQEFLKQRARVEAACATWEKEGRNPAYLIQPGKPLDDALWLLSQTGRTMATESAGFIQASKSHANEDARRRKRNRVIAVSAAALLIGAAVIGGVIAFQASQRAAERRVQADAYFQVHQAALQLARGELRPALVCLNRRLPRIRTSRRDRRFFPRSPRRRISWKHHSPDSEEACRSSNSGRTICSPPPPAARSGSSTREARRHPARHSFRTAKKRRPSFASRAARTEAGSRSARMERRSP